MNTKQFRGRWVNRYVEPELFYLPVGKKDKKQKPFIFEICDEYLRPLPIAFTVFPYISTSSNSNAISIFEQNGDFIKTTPHFADWYNRGYKKDRTYIIPDICPAYGESIYVSYTSLPFYLTSNKVKDDEGNIITVTTKNYITEEMQPDWFNDGYFHINLSSEQCTFSKKLIFENQPEFKEFGAPYAVLDDGTVFKDMYKEGNNVKTGHLINVDDAQYDIYYSPIVYSYSFLKDENGESMFEPVTYTSIIHKFKTSGRHTIKLYGWFPRIQLPQNTSKIVQWGNVDLKSLYNMFYNIGNNPFLYNGSERKYLSDTYYFFEDIAEPTGLENVESAAQIFGYNLYMTFISYNALRKIFNIYKYLGNNLIYAKEMLRLNLYFTEDFPDNIDILIGDNFLSNKEKLKVAADCLNLTVYKGISTLNETQTNYNINYNAVNINTIVIGDNFFYNTPSLCDTATSPICSNYNITLYDSSTKIFIGNNYYSNSGIMYLNSNIIKDYATQRLVSVGKNAFRNCKNLLQVNGLMCYDMTENIGEGMFRGCPNIRYFNGQFEKKILKKIPDYLFYDLKHNELVEYPYLYFPFSDIFSQHGVYINSGNILSTEIGSHMFNPSFLSSLGNHKMHISRSFTYTSNRYTGCVFSETVYPCKNNNGYDDYNKHYQIYWALYHGEVPDFWNYPKASITTSS